MTILFDRHGAVETTGLERCTMTKLAATDTARARKVCPGAIVGEGQGTAIVVFPEQAPIRASSPITLFNGPPDHGAPTVLAHAYLSVPAPTTYIVPIVIEPIHDGIYGYRTKATIPPIAGGYGVPISGHLKIGKKWTYKGKRYSYVNARCETGKLEAKGESQVGGSGVTPRQSLHAACSAGTSSRPSSPWSLRTRASDSSER